MSIDNVKALVRCSSHNGLLDGAVLLDKRCAFPKTRYRVREARHWRLETLRSAYEGEDSSLSLKNERRASSLELLEAATRRLPKNSSADKQRIVPTVSQQCVH
jgi:hypothetical protein